VDDAGRGIRGSTNATGELVKKTTEGRSSTSVGKKDEQANKKKRKGAGSWDRFRPDKVGNKSRGIEVLYNGGRASRRGKYTGGGGRKQGR